MGGTHRMDTTDQSDEGEDNSQPTDLPAEWDRTERQPRLPDGNLGTFETAQGTCFYDRDQPGRYIIRQALEIGEHTAYQEGTP